MKLRKLFLAVLAGATMLMACDKKEVDLGPAKLTVNPTDVSFEAEVSSQDISLVATRDWAVTSLPDWVALSKESGAANPAGQKLSVSVTENKGHNRSATIIFSIGFARQALTISQVGPEGVVDNGDGSKENPYTVAGAIEYVKGLGADVESPKKVFVKGIVSTVETTYEASGTYGNATFNIVDEEGSSDVFKVFQTYYLGNVKWTKADNNPDIKEKDEVIIYGTIYNYKGNTPETVGKGASFVYSLNGVNRGGADSGSGDGTAKGTGTLEDPYNPAGAAAAVASLTWTDKDNYDKTEPVYIKGKISKVSTTFEASGSYGNASFTIVDETDGTGSFEVFQTYYLGNRQWKTGDTEIKVDDIVIVHGPIMNYKGNTPETVGKGASYIYSLNGTTDGGGQGGGTGTPSGDGTQANPYNVAAAVAAVKDLTWTSNTDFQKVGPFYVKGKVSSVKFAFDAEHGTATFNLSDDGTETAAQFTCYSVKYYDGAAWVEGNTQVTVGADVVIYGELQNYKGNTPETVTGSYVVSISGGGVTPPPAAHDGLTLETAFTASEANAWIMANIEGNNNTGDTKYYVKGIIQRFYQRDNADQNFTNNSYKQASFYITDDGKEAADKEFEAYQINYLAGATFDATKDTDVKVGDEVVIYGPLAKYNTTAETAGKGAAYLYSVNAGGEVPPTPGPGGDEVGIMETNVTMIAGTNAYDDGKLTVTYNGTTYENVKHIKYGKGTAYGNGSIVLPAGTVEIEFFAVGWKGKDATLQFTIGETVKKVNVAANDGAANTSPYSMTVADSDHYTVSLGSALAVETTVKVETIADANTGYRAFLFGVHAKKTSGGDTPGGDTPGGDTPAKPVNEGTLESPFTVAYALIAAKDAELTGKQYYVKAVVGKDIAIKNGAASFELMDGTTDGKLTVVKAKSFKGAAFDGSEPLDWLDEVVLKGTVTEYSTLPALTEGELVKWNGKTMFKAAFTTIAQLNALATTTATEYTGTLENAVVSFVPDAKNAIIKDATGSVLYFKNGHGLKQGQTFSGDVTVKLVLYNNASEITAIDAAFTGEEAVVEPESVSLSALAADFAKYQNAYVKVKDLEVVSVSGKNINVKNGNDTYVVYSSAGNATVEVGKTITATGTICQYSNKAQIKAWTMDAVEVQTQTQTPAWTLKNLSELADGDIAVIVSIKGEDKFALSNDKGTAAAPTAVAFTEDGNPAANIQWTVSVSESKYSFTASDTNMLYCTASNNGVRVGTNTNNVFVIDAASGYLKNVATERYLGVYNKADWRCYTNTTGNTAGQTFKAYVKTK
jgi:hypothetical protein